MKQINNIKIDVKNGNVATENVECIVVPEFDSCAYLMEVQDMQLKLQE